jgi:hypothetical protein
MKNIKIGTIKTDNEKNKWIYIDYNKNTKKWIKLHGTISKYKTHGNGENPFYVIITDKIIYILKKSTILEEDWEKCMIISKYINVFIGKNIKKYSPWPSYGTFPGNSILIEIKPLNYIFIGYMIASFTTLEPIIKYISIMGNSDVTYPFAITKNYMYMMLDFMYIKRIKGDPDPYSYLFGQKSKEIPKPKKTTNKILVK